MSRLLRKTIRLAQKPFQQTGLHFRFGTRCMSSLDISGIYPPIPTPFNNDESISYNKLQKNLEKWNKIPFKGYVVQGSNGEYAYLTTSERVELVQKIVEWAGDKKLIIAGTGCESTRDTITMTQKMADVGAKAALVVTPCYYKSGMNNAALIDHYTKVANASPIPVILYSVPGNTGIDLAPEVTIKLSEHENIIGIKESGGDISKIGSIVHATQRNNFQVLAGSASFLLPAYVMGCVGGVLGLANVLGEACCELGQLYKEGKMEEAKLLQQRLIGPNMAVTKRFGVPGVKVSMEWFGYYGGPTRSPLQPIGQSDIDIIKNIFKSDGFLSN